MYLIYCARLITAEYRDCVERAKRLASAKEAVWQKSSIAAQSVQTDDLLIYLRWLICQHHSVKRVNQFLNVSPTISLQVCSDAVFVSF